MICDTTGSPATRPSQPSGTRCSESSGNKRKLEMHKGIISRESMVVTRPATRLSQPSGTRCSESSGNKRKLEMHKGIISRQSVVVRLVRKLIRSVGILMSPNNCNTSLRPTFDYK
jgi:hypothetical protein